MLGMLGRKKKLEKETLDRAIKQEAIDAQIERSKKPLRSYTVKLKGEEPMDIQAHTYADWLSDSDSWVRFSNDMEDRRVLAFVCRRDDLEWMKGNGEVQ